MISPITNTFTKIKNKCKKASFGGVFASLEKFHANSGINNINQLTFMPLFLIQRQINFPCYLVFGVY